MARQSKKVSLTTEQLQKDNKRYSRRSKVTFQDGRYTYINPFFSPQKIETMLEDYANFIAEYEKRGNALTEKSILNYVYLFIVLHFSELVQYDKNMDFESKVLTLDEMLNHEYVIEIGDHFNENEVAKVYTFMAKKMEAVLKMSEQNRKFKEELLKKIDTMKLENKDLIKGMIQNGDIQES